MPQQNVVLGAATLSASNTVEPINYNSLIRKCSVRINQTYKTNDFVCVSSGVNPLPRIAKIVHVKNETAKVSFFLRESELPEPLYKIKTENGSTIKMIRSEVVDDWIAGVKEVPLKSIASKCTVIERKATDDSSTIFKAHKETRENHDVYICRYRLVKQSSYVLLPIKWIACDAIEQRRTEVKKGQKNGIIYADEQITYESDDPLADHHFEAATTQLANMQLQVSPLKILNQNSVQKIKRPAQQESAVKERTVNEDDDSKGSPNKRKRNERNVLDSPVTTGTTPSRRQASIRKNLNDSFLADDDATNNEDVYKITKTDDLKMKISTGRKYDAGREMTVNEETPSKRNARRKLTQVEQLRADEAATTPRSRKSILRTPSSNTLNTPKKSVKIDATPVVDKDVLMLTPSRPKRNAAQQAIAQIIETMHQYSPEERPAGRRGRSASVASRAGDTEYTTPVKKTAERAPMTPKSTKSRTSTLKTPSKTSELTPQMTRKLFRSGNLTPSIQSRKSAIHESLTELQQIRERLHVSAVPQSLPCRESEYKNIYTFVRDKIVDGLGGCIYIAGVPGTGKTATVTQVVKALQHESGKRLLPKFDYVDINGMRLTEPHQAYVQIHRQLTGATVPWAQARELLEKRFTKTKTGRASKDVTTILLIDELDILCNRKQDVVYNLFDWTTKKGSKLVAITIANTMDLPERVLKLKVASRLGLTRITFQPYAFKQLQQVVMTRLAGSQSFISDAVQLVARKVASVSGDCRRALDICRRATEIAEEATGDTNAVVQFVHVTNALEEMFASPQVRAIRNCSKMEKLFLRAVASEITRTGIEEVDFLGVYAQLQVLAALMGISRPPNICQAQRICLNLGASRILIVEDSSADIYQKIILNMSVDDLHFALNESKE